MTRIIEVSTGGGAIPEVPGYSGAIRARLADDGTVLEVVPFGTPFKDEIAPAPIIEEAVVTDAIPQPTAVEEPPSPPEVQPLSSVQIEVETTGTPEHMSQVE